MKIVILSGGTGSVQLQQGLYNVFGGDVLDYTIITNLADNGLSTGVCRRVMDGKMMGPSDLRKNQMLRAQLEKSISQELYSYLDERITCKASEVKHLLLRNLHLLDCTPEVKHILIAGIEGFFSMPASLEIDYDDFSVSNIIYSGLAKLNNYSLDAAGKLFETVLNIPADSVISNTDRSMYLRAKTQSGYEILDEGDIVQWNNPNDRIVSCHFVDTRGKDTHPIMNDKSIQMIHDADIIIFSTGTQWSSLIPTYMSYGFKSALANSSAEKYLILNNQQDKDVKGVSGDELLETLGKYLPLSNINIVCDSTGDPLLIPTGDVIKAELSSYDKKHDGSKLVKTIFTHYYKDYICNPLQVFDYDDTIVARGEKDANVSASNIELIQRIKQNYEVWISTGNSVKAIKKGFRELNVLADGGVNRYRIGEEGDIFFLECLDESLKFSNEEVDVLLKRINDCAVDVSKVQIRGNVMMSIKPISPEYRTSIVILLQSVLPEYSVKATGRTTIDITKLHMSKSIALQKLFNKQFTFVGDEGYPGGNDFDMRRAPNCNFVDVMSVKDTNMYLKLLDFKRWN
jgi:HAD superfamily hydrolase (TIGR01484 family)